MAASVLRAAKNVLWSESFWFANGTTWADLESADPDVYYPKVADINMSFFVGVLLLGVRYMYERFLVHPVAVRLGLKEKKVFVSPSPALEALYKVTKGKLSKSDIQKAIKQTDFTEKQIHRWFFKRRLKDVPSAIFRFKDQSWQLLFYSTAFCYGMFTLWDKPWLWDTTYCWRDWPKQHVSNEVYYFYVVELGFYWCLLFTLFYDVKRKDFAEMVTHHMATMSLLYLSWMVNYVRIGTLVLVVHDASDHWMAAAKMAKYCKKQMLCEILFFIFILIWVACRLFIYPFRILHSTYYEVHMFVDVGMSFWLFNGLLMLLQVLHIVWTGLIFKVVYIKVTRGSIERDIRSDTSGLEDELDKLESDDEDQGHSIKQNGKPVMNGVSTARSTRNHNSYVK